MDFAAILAEVRAKRGSVSLTSAFEELRKLQATPIPVGESLAIPRVERDRKYRQREKARRLEDICILDFETDPFDNKRPHEEIYPFLAVLYRENYEPIVIWDDNPERLIDKTVTAIETMEGRYTIYAHNGGRFDYKFLIRHLRGEIKFKGNSIMKATIGEHELRDSLHILPTGLASLKKDAFDYSKMHRKQRHKHREQIIEYCINDCKYALEFVKHFVGQHGFKISIGQAAFAQIKRLYPDIENLNERLDGIFRQFFFGGRVEFFDGHIHEKKPFKYIDLNSAYPAVMANVKHPIGKSWVEDTEITRETFFVELTCHSRGAFVTRIKSETGAMETRCPIGYGHYYTTIHEYKAAVDLGLISDVKIIKTWNCHLSTDFSKFVIPNYDGRRAKTAEMKTLDTASVEWDNLNKDQTIMKFLLNNGYGKFAQDPKRYKETYQLPYGEKPEGDGWEEIYLASDYVTWERPNPSFRYNNVATGASITGAQRAVLMRALNTVKRPLYCDTDSIICEDTGALELHDTKLGAWKVEAELNELLINGKKFYAYQDIKKTKPTIRAKGTSGISMDEMILINQGEKLTFWQKGITLRNDGTQYYTHRAVKKTGQSETFRANH